MDIYTLNRSFEKVEVFDSYSSFIWTERWQEFGDFQLDAESSRKSRSIFVPGTIINIGETNRAMLVEQAEDSLDTDGTEVFRVKGRSLESLLDHRGSHTGLNTTYNSVWYGTPRSLVGGMISRAFVLPTLDPLDEIPNLNSYAYVDGSLPTYDTQIRIVQEPDNLWERVSSLLKAYNLGFRVMVYPGTASFASMQTYTGNDLTTNQTDLSPVVFSVALDNLEQTSEFVSIEDSKNVAYVFSDRASIVVYREGEDPRSGIDRRALTIKTTIPDDVLPADEVEYLEQIGREALRDHKTIDLFDGQIDEHGEYVYDVDYKLGDLVEVRTRDDRVGYKMVTEQTFVSDEEGERSYPGLSEGELDNPFAWYNGWYDDTAWEDYTTEHWEDL